MNIIQESNTKKDKTKENSNKTITNKTDRNKNNTKKTKFNDITTIIHNSKYVLNKNKKTILSNLLPILVTYGGFRWYLSDTHTWVENIQSNELDNVLKQEIDKFTSIKGEDGETIFKVSDNFKTFDKRVQILILGTINDILDLLPNFKNKLVKKYSTCENGFTLGSSDDFSNFPTQAMGVPVCALTSYGQGIYINKLFGNHLKLSKFLGKTFVKFGFNCPLIPTQIIQGAIRHELGHLFSFVVGKTPNDLESVSKYGDSSNAENYAEHFANLFSGKPIEYVQKTFLNHIRDTEPNLTMEKIKELR